MNECGDNIEIAFFGHRVIVVSVGNLLPDLGVGTADGIQCLHVRWTGECCVSGRQIEQRGAYYLRDNLIF